MPTDKDKQIESEDFEERCAIREYLGNVPRDQAERETREEFTNVLRGKPLRPHKRQRKVSWRSGRIREDADGMRELRVAACARAAGKCQCGQLETPPIICPKRVTWYDGELHHVLSRARGGSDTLDNVIYVNPLCHRRITGEPTWSRSA
jgi:hypothetical protein